MKLKSSSKLHKTLTIGFSPCPNDCFIFHALLHKKIDTEGISFIPVIEDVEALNKKAFNEKLDISKISFFTYAQLQKKYTLLESGSALGFGVGPLVVSRNSNPLQKELLQQTINSKLKLAIPGKNTTANLLFSLAYPKLKNKTEMLFSKIEDEVLKGNFDLGLIIHESRFTYKEKGLTKVIDLGAWWEKKTKSPIPLGGIAINKKFSKQIQEKVDRVIRRSVKYAFANPNSSRAFIKEHAQEMNDKVIKQHIALYVNKYSVSLGSKGKKAVMTLLKEIEKNKL